MLILVKVGTIFDLFMPNVTYYLTSLCRNRATRILKQCQARSTLNREKRNRSQRSGIRSCLEALIDDALYFLGQQTHYESGTLELLISVYSNWKVSSGLNTRSGKAINCDKYRPDLAIFYKIERDVACASLNRKDYIIKWISKSHR